MKREMVPEVRPSRPKRFVHVSARKVLQDMGYEDNDAIEEALNEYNGDVGPAIPYLDALLRRRR